MDEERFEELAGEVTVERTVTLPADPDTVWERLTDENLVSGWMEGDVQIEARPGGAITMTPDDGPAIWGTVEEVIHGRRLQWSWRTDDGLPTQVEIELAPTDEGTALTVRETLLPWRVSGLPPQWANLPYPRSFLSAAA
jgi:uncharacterized protein YndB with AHSA1/START domain